MDITFCTNKDCPLADTCRRSLHYPGSQRQSYAFIKPNDDGTCDHFMKLEMKSVYKSRAEMMSDPAVTKEVEDFVKELKKYE